MTAPARPAAPPPRHHHSTLWADEACRMDLLSGDTRHDTLVITFDPILYGAEQPPFAFALLDKLPVDILAVRKLAEHFYQPLDRAQFLTVAAPLAASYARVVAYGSSLGAYAALYYASGLDCAVVASSPRISIHPTHGIERWQRRQAFLHQGFDQLPPPRCRVLVIHDPHDALDGPFMREVVLPCFPQAEQLPAPYSGHPSNHFLAEIGLIAPLMRAVIAGQPRPAYQRRALRGRSCSYLHGLALACARRGKPHWARRLAHRAVTVNPSSALARRVQAQIHLLAEEAAEALAAAEAAHQRNTTDEVTIQLMFEAARALGQEATLRSRYPGLRPPPDAPPALPAARPRPGWVERLRHRLSRLTTGKD